MGATNVDEDAIGEDVEWIVSKQVLGLITFASVEHAHGVGEAFGARRVFGEFGVNGIIGRFGERETLSLV